MTSCEFINMVNKLRKAKPKPVISDGLKFEHFEMNMLMTISVLMHKNGRVKAGDLSGELGINKSALSRMLKAFEEKGLVERVNSKDDRREVYIYLTDEGEKVCKTAQDSIGKKIEEFFLRMGESDTQEIVRLIEKSMKIWEEINV